MDSDGQCPLSKIEIHLLEEAASGNSDSDELAERMGLSHGTVNQYFKRIYATLKVGNRADAITAAHRKGWITIPRDTEA